MLPSSNTTVHTLTVTVTFAYWAIGHDKRDVIFFSIKQ
uniref:Uncharacterized protein n=1 Tax=Arundo donax TaxID=35708 RepID=A0A0A9FYK3_ARUDO